MMRVRLDVGYATD